MKYVPKILDSNINAPSENFFITIFNFLFYSFLLLFLIYIITGFIAEIIAKKIPWEYEEKIGYTIFVYDDKIITEKEKRLQKLLNNLLRYSDKLKDKKIKVKIYEKKKKNALALPGGKIIVFSGILDITKNEEEIAAILAHELGHYANRDHLRALGRQLILVFLFSLISGSDNITSKIFSSSLDNIQLKYSREQEKKADLFAAGLLHKKYRRANGLIELLSKLGKNENLPKFLVFFSTHPSSDERIRVIKNYIKRNFKEELK